MYVNCFDNIFHAEEDELQLKMKKLEKLQLEVAQIAHKKKQAAIEKENERPGKLQYLLCRCSLNRVVIDRRSDVESEDEPEVPARRTSSSV